jgi:hypothetical protein
MRKQHSPEESELHELHIQLPDNDDSDSISATDDAESEHRSSNRSAPTNDVPERSLLQLSASSESPQPLGGFARIARILYHQFKGIPPPSTLAVPSHENRFTVITGPGSLDGINLVYDRNTASIPGLHLPLALDMVRDGAKNRMLNVLGFACIFCSVILILASFIFVAPQAPIPHKVLSCCAACNLCCLTTPPALLPSDCPCQSTGFAVASNQLSRHKTQSWLRSPAAPMLDERKPPGHDHRRLGHSEPTNYRLRIVFFSVFHC